jgi:hypothetical protein
MLTEPEQKHIIVELGEAADRLLHPLVDDLLLRLVPAGPVAHDRPETILEWIVTYSTRCRIRDVASVPP